jgi:HSP20 family protein
MKFIDRNIIRSFANQIDLLNSMNGGVSMTTVDIEQGDESIIIRVSAPSVQPEAFNIFVDFNKLIIVSELSSDNVVEVDDEDMDVRIPMFFRSFDIPFFVDGNLIEAVYDNGELMVILPFKETDNQLQRKINIRQL